MSVRVSPKRRLSACTAAVCEDLERRRLLTIFYDYDVIARAGSTVTVAGDTISSFVGETSVNDNGRVAFIANVTGANGNGRAVIASPAGIGQVQKITFANPSTARNFDIAQITNDNKVVTTDSISGARLLRTWDANSPGNFTLITRTDTNNAAPAPVFGTYASVQLASRAEDGDTAYIGFREGDNTPIEVFLRGSTHISMGTVAGGGFRLSAGNNGRAVTRAFAGGGDSILIFDKTGANVVLAGPANNFTQVSQPGMSDDGTIVAFAGNHSTTGQGIYLSQFVTGTGWSAPITIFSSASG